MKKILFIHHAAGWGGAPNSMIKLINSLDKKKYECKVLLLKQSIVAKKLEENNINYSVVNSLFYKKYYHYFTHSEADYVKWYNLIKFFKLTFFWCLSRYFFAKKELKNLNFDLVHLNSSVLTDWLAPSRRKGKVILHIREPFRKGKIDFLHPVFKRQMYKYADRIIAISKDNAERINLEEKTTVVYNYSEIERLPPLKEQDYTSNTVLYVGGYSKIKGFFTVVKSLEYLDDDIKILFAGYYPKKNNNNSFNLKAFLKRIIYRKEYKLYALFLKNKKAVKVGLLDDINAYLDKTTCLISPFTVPHFSRPIIESFARRKPVIATIIPGMAEIVDDNEIGVLVKNKDAKALAIAINNMCNDAVKAKKLGDEGYLKASKKFSPSNIYIIIQLYKELI